LPRVVVRGKPYERGRQYGRQTRELILRSIAAYRQLFLYRQKLDWSAAVRHARAYEDSIGMFSPDILQEIYGIASGADVDTGDILALNLRSELMFVPRLSGALPAAAGECTSFAVLPEASDSGHTIVGQNWDWLPFAGETVIILEAHRDDGPGFMTITEAGLVAKIGINSAGLGVCSNTLVSELDKGDLGVPYHVMLRSLLDAETIDDAARMLTAAPRAFSGNYLVAHSTGAAFNAETESGGAARVAITLPEEGILAHSNHFLQPEMAQHDARVALHPHSLSRLDSMRQALRRGLPGVSIDLLKGALSSHQGHPDGVCSHPNPRTAPLDQRATLASMIADLYAGELWIAAGAPCSQEYRRYDVRSAFDAPLEYVRAS
jgi:isopenicillin-N N-acyltransferase-like protein